MARKKTNEQFAKEVYDLVKDEYEFLEKYKGSNIKIRCLHNTCGHEWDIIPCSFLRGRRCPECTMKIISKRLTKTNEKFIQEVYDLVGNEYTFVEKYINDRTKIKCKHNECGYIWEIVPSSFLQGRGCPKCKGKKISTSKTRDDKWFKEEVYKLVGDEYTFLEEYKTSRTKIKVRHNECGHVYKVKPNHFFNGTRCPNHIVRTEEDFLEKVQKLAGDEYSFIGGYINTATKIKCRHNKCGYEWMIKPNNFLSGQRCPQCAESKGEQVIRKYLENNNVRFLQEYEFDNLLSDKGNPLRFDFAIFNKKDNLISLIEYDGEFHFKDVYENGSFEVQQIHDKRKNQYCKDNDIPLIRIPYWQFDKIEEILEEWLAKYNLQQKVKVS